MEIGAAIFFTDYSMEPTELAVALEERGFDSLWVAEHSHIPVFRRFTHPQGEAALTKEYYDVMDPFVTLTAAAAVTTRLKLGTAVCLVIQRDTVQTAKLVASLDQVSKGRFLFGIGCGWNAEEMASGVEVADQLRPAVQHWEDLVGLRWRQADVHSGHAEIAVTLQQIQVFRGAAECHRQGLRIAPGLYRHLAQARHELFGAAGTRAGRRR
jgi:alkanesulfonate monooxygenase SsuD/methylene tetrahydromethanopterin reductase-like flavin-dependent oxidoreductase (luciferase family)